VVGTLDATIARVAETAQRRRRWKIIRDRSSETHVAIECGPTLRSAGESIEVTIEASGPMQTCVSVVSTSLKPMVLFDYGKNHANVKRILRELQHVSHSSVT